MKKSISLIIVFIAVLISDTFSCTIIMVKGNGVDIAESLEKAIAEYNKTLEIDPKHEGARKALIKIRKQ